jgi:DnaJ-class molecular chaperone
MRLLRPCSTCGGRGKLATPCSACHGTGMVRTVRPLTVRIPPGADDGDRLRAGNILIETRVRSHPHFRRDGLDLHLRLPVTLSEALSGGTVEVPTPDGPVRLKIPPRSQPGARLRLRDKGVARGSSRGDLLVELDVRLPDQEDADLASAARAADHAYSRPVREGIGL